MSYLTIRVCTPTYLKRFRGQEWEGGKGANFEGLIISQMLYNVYYRNTKFIPVIPINGDFRHVPLPVGCKNTNEPYDIVIVQYYG
jgi:hypothetical protein